MAKVRVEWVERYACDELDAMRKMLDTRDFSGLSSAIERLQVHCNSMETALYNRRDTISGINRVLSNRDLKNKERLNQIKKLVEKK